MSRNPNNLDLETATRIAFATNHSLGMRAWTELSVWFLPNADGRVFLAEVLGKFTDGERTERRKRVYVGTLDRALNWFEDSGLADQIETEARDWMERNPTAVADALKDLRHPVARKLGFTGKGGLAGALAWLYGQPSEGVSHSTAQLSSMLEADFGVPARTVRHALAQEKSGSGLTGWALGFIAALTFFDRDAFIANRRR